MPIAFSFLSWAAWKPGERHDPNDEAIICGGTWPLSYGLELPELSGGSSPISTMKTSGQVAYYESLPGAW